MIGLDTNVLVRFFTQDDEIQAARATEIMEHVLTLEEPGYVSVPTILELAWVLRRSYGTSNAKVAEILERMLGAQKLVIQNAEQVAVAAEALRDGTASFADALVGALCVWAGCTSILSFDRQAQRLPGFRPA